MSKIILWESTEEEVFGMRFIIRMKKGEEGRRLYF